MPKPASLASRVYILEHELARVAALVEGAQRTCARLDWRLEEILGRISRAFDASMDKYDTTGPLDARLKEEEQDRAAKLDDEEPA